MILLQRHANILPFRMFPRIAIIPHVTRLRGEDTMVTAELAVFTGEPRGSPLAEDDVAWDDEFAW